eukprot:183102_1
MSLPRRMVVIYFGSKKMGSKSESSQANPSKSEEKIIEFIDRRLDELCGRNLQLRMGRLSDSDLRALRVSVSGKMTDCLKRIDEEMTDRLGCAVCMEPKKLIIFLPCAHQKVCAECAKQLKSCPVCRRDIDKTVHPNRPQKRQRTALTEE